MSGRPSTTFPVAEVALPFNTERARHLGIGRVVFSLFSPDTSIFTN
jgi:hypothetical protein